MPPREGMTYGNFPQENPSQSQRKELMSEIEARTKNVDQYMRWFESIKKNPNKLPGIWDIRIRKPKGEIKNVFIHIRQKHESPGDIIQFGSALTNLASKKGDMKVAFSHIRDGMLRVHKEGIYLSDMQHVMKVQSEISECLQALKSTKLMSYTTEATTTSIQGAQNVYHACVHQSLEHIYALAYTRWSSMPSGNLKNQCTKVLVDLDQYIQQQGYAKSLPHLKDKQGDLIVNQYVRGHQIGLWEMKPRKLVFPELRKKIETSSGKKAEWYSWEGRENETVKENMKNPSRPGVMVVVYGAGHDFGNNLKEGTALIELTPRSLVNNKNLFVSR